MTPAAPARVKPPSASGAGASPRTAPRRSPRAPGPRRVSGPVRTRPSVDRRQSAARRPSTLLRSLPDHALLDRLVRGRVWISLLGVMLVGIVAMQVELLKLNASTGRSIELISSLQSRNEALRVAVASASDPTRIERIATGMGMTMPGPEAITFLSARSVSVQRAMAGIHPPNVAAFEAALRVTNASASTPTAGALPTTPPPAPANQGANKTTASTPTSTATTAGQTTTTAGQTTSTKTTAGQTTTTAGQTTSTATTAGQTNTAAAPPPTVP